LRADRSGLGGLVAARTWRLQGVLGTAGVEALRFFGASFFKKTSRKVMAPSGKRKIA
jgi:hypothetical protein